MGQVFDRFKKPEWQANLHPEKGYILIKTGGQLKLTLLKKIRLVISTRTDLWHTREEFRRPPKTSAGEREERHILKGKAERSLER